MQVQDNRDLYGDIGDTMAGPDNPMVTDASDNAVYALAKKWNMDWDASTKDWLTQYYLSGKLAEENWQRELLSDSSKYQRAMKDLVAAGLNPAQVLGSLSGSNPGSSGNVSGSHYTQLQATRETNAKDIGKSVFSMLLTIAAIGISMLAM